jgi:uncharacterized protein (DUF305 family)
VADVRFMQRMVEHHAQALVMTALVPSRGGHNDVKLIAERIEISQRDEMAMMRRWLTERGETVPDPTAGHQHHEGMVMMPGMLAPVEMEQLRRATGLAFDRLFLRFMTRHHEGALTMVAEFFATPGAGQESEIFRFASDVDADQRAEIARLRSLEQQLQRARLGSAPRR